jgi:hypothetical protein
MKKLIVLLVVAALTVPAWADYRSTVLADNPLSLWEFEDAASNDGAPCADTVGISNGVYRNRGAAVPDIALVPGLIGKAAEFHGTAGSGNGNFVQIYDSSYTNPPYRLESSPTLTIEFMEKAGTTASETYGRFISHANGGTGNYWMGMTSTGANAGQPFVGVVGGTWYAWPPILASNSWHHVAVTYAYDGTNTTTTLYIDGINRGSDTRAGALTPPGDWQDLIIGAENNPYYVYNGLVGQMDEVAYYNYALNQNQVTAHFNAISEPAIDPNKASHPNPSNGASEVPVSAGLSWDAPTGYTPTSYDVYFGTNPTAHSNPKNTVDTNSYDPPGDLAIGTIYYWAIDSNDAGTIYAGDDWSFTTSPIDPNKASHPNPSNGASEVPVSAGLSWDAPTGFTPTSYDVYFGTDTNAHSNPKYTVYTNSYDPPGDLAFGTTYYWAVDSNDAGTIYAGDDWSFTTSIPVSTWRADARCFLDGPSGAFDDISVKDPTIVYSGDKWHLFYTGRDSSMWRMGYATATSIAGLKTATHTYMSSLNGGSYFCAPQVFWFEAKGKWYLIYQSGLAATFSTNTDINNPSGWTAGVGMGFGSGAVDFWCISDGNNVYCFYSPQNGSYVIKRRSTTVADFPYNWSADSNVCSSTFEAPHVYKNIADGKYYMMVEDITRHQELWTANNPGGSWTKLAENWAAKSNLIEMAEHWTDQVSHGEIIRAGVDERMEISDIYHCEILIQGVVNGSYGDYGNIPYDLGIIRQCPAGPADLNLDCDVDFVDFAVLAQQWQQPPGVPSADIEPPGGDGIVDMNDLVLLVDSWLWEI